ncbi:hypothetical protein GCM10022408_37910 [Hymenobacter fastidiosus]|uniref:Uncharacterized protein n=1 Tax=Hymenobacter fastidiosus TaxID=486264 RepID=A0ABP7T3I3_9BACT
MQACALPALYVGFREVTPATVLDWVTEHGIGNLPRLQWVLGRLCYADLLRAEEVTSKLWHIDQLRHVLPSGELIHITPAQRADSMPAAAYVAEATSIQENVLVLTESTHLLSLTRQECLESAIAVELLAAGKYTEAALNPTQAARWAFNRQLRALLTSLDITPIACQPQSERVDDYLPYEVLRLPEEIVRRCREHIDAHLDEDTPQREKKIWQLVFLAWLAANNHILYCAESGSMTVSTPFVFDGGLFDNRTAGELLDEYDLWHLAPWLRDGGRFL